MPARARETVRIAMIGAGRMANHVHYPSLASFPDVQIAAICDLDEDRMLTTAKTYGIDKRYTNYRTMIEECAPDGVYAIGPPHIMYDIWMWCLEQGQNLYIEKPMGITWHQARMLAHLVDQQGLVTQVSHQRRTCPLLVKMRQECLARGAMVHAVCEFHKCEQRPCSHACDHMLDDCTHAIDTVRWLCGGEVVSITSHCKRVGVPDINWIGAMLQFDSGATGFVVGSWTSGRRVFRVQMQAPGILIDADIEGQAHLYANGNVQPQEYDAQRVAGSAEYYVFGGFRAKHREFIDSLKYGKDVTSSPFRDCLKIMEVAEKILAQALLRGA